MPRQNRVTPYGTIIATAARGTFMGNRGILHDDQQQIVRSYASKAWIICRLAFKGRKRTLMSPGKYTELFFLDEATALAAGHRPCYECQRDRAQAFRDAWVAGNPELVNSRAIKMGDIDAVLHQERLTEARRIKDRRKRTYVAAIDDLPNGTFVEWGERTYLVWGLALYPWKPEGYGMLEKRPSGIEVTVLTPYSTVQALMQGFEPMVHETAVASKAFPSS